MKFNNTKKLTYCAMFAALATILMYFELPLPFIPPFLKIDLSGVASLLAGFMFGWGPAVLVTLVKDIIHIFTSTSGGVGQIADFFMISTFCIIASVVYKKKHTKNGAIIGLLLGSIGMTVVGIFTNKYMLIPFFSKVMPLDAIISACNAVNPMIDSINGYIIFGAIPFNLFKGMVLTLITLLLYKKLSVFIRQNTIKNVDKLYTQKFPAFIRQNSIKNVDKPIEK